MIEIRISGGVGNQLFQYAFGYALAQKNGQKLILDKSYFDYDNSRIYELNMFQLDLNETVSYMKGIENKGIKRYLQILFNIQKKRHKLKDYIIIQEANEIPKTLNTGNFYFRGFWQNENFFRIYKKELIRQIEPNWELSETYLEWLGRIREKDSVSIHVRRTDYLKYQAAINSEFYILAVKKILELVKTDMFYIFTDDVNWTRNFFLSCPVCMPYTIVSGQDKLSDLEELMLMKACRHHIIANSSFSWWAAWLGENENQIVIAPKVEMWNESFYPKEWMLIDTEIENMEQLVKKNKCHYLAVKEKIVEKIKGIGYL